MLTELLTGLTVLLIGLAFVWWNEYQAKKVRNSGDCILRDVLIKYDDGTVLHIYEVKTIEDVPSIRSYNVSPDVRHTNFIELQAILKFKDHLEECGLTMDLEQAAELWANTMAKKWRENYTEEFLEGRVDSEALKVLDAEDVE